MRIFQHWLGGAGVLAVCIAGWAEPVSLGIRGSAAAGEVKLEPFSALPPAKSSPYKAATPGRIASGGEGLRPAAPAAISGTTTLAIMGDLAPATPASAPGVTLADKYVPLAVSQMNLLRPDLVMTVGNLVPGMSRSGSAYIQQVQSVRNMLDGLKMPWYPCAGERDLWSGTGQASDRRFEGLYQQYQGPLYYSVDNGAVHAIVLNSETSPGSGGIDERQFAWLKADLNRVFEGSGANRAQWVVVVVHRALWRGAAAGEKEGWGRVHDLLVAFNRRPIVSVEGIGGSAGAEARGPRVAGVFAGGELAYAMEGARDGIRYYVLGPTGAMPRRGEDTTTALRHIMLVKFDAGDMSGAGGGMHCALVALGGDGTGVLADGPILSEEIITAAERDTLDKIAAWGNDIIGIDGVIDQRPPNVPPPPAQPDKKPLRLRLNNPLREPIDLSIRMAGTRFLSSTSRREQANTSVEGLDLPWELSTSHIIRHLLPGAKDGWDIEITRPEESTATTAFDAPPQVEFVVTWTDPRGRVHEIILKRRVALAPAARVPVAEDIKDEAIWKSAAGGSAYAWEVRGDEPRKLNPTWQMIADGEKLYVRVRVDDAVPSYWPRMLIDGAHGGLPSDAVCVEWTPDGKAETVQRVWVVPDAPRGEQLWTSSGLGQTALLKLDPKWGITADIQQLRGGSYEVMLAVPRSLVFTAVAAAAPRPIVAPPIGIPLLPPPFNLAPAASPPPPPVPRVVGTGLLNIVIHDNDQAARTWTRSWAPEDPAVWGRVELVVPAGK